jgi:hypothetical protein
MMRIGLTITAAIVAASPVPAGVQQAIPKEVPAHLRYMPTEVPTGYRYVKWHGARSGLEIDFARKGWPPTLAFLAERSGPPGTCGPGGTHPYRFGSVRVSFERDRYTEQFWRCARARTVTVAATIRRTDVVTPAKRRAIAAMVAAATPLG